MSKLPNATKPDEWGQGWDYLFKEIWDDMDRIREDNLAYRYSHKNIDHCFKFLYSTLVKEVLSKVKSSDWNERDKNEVMGKVHRLIKLFRESKSYPDKVIAINMTEQFLRAIY